MHWTNKHDILLVREVLALDPYSLPKGKERADVWEAIAGHLSACTDPKFLVCGRSVKDRIQLVLIRNYKKKMAEEIRATGIEVDPPTELEMAMEEITEKYDASEKDAKSQSEEKKEKLEKERKQAEEVRNQALERIGETKKRKSLEGEDETKPRRPRRQGNDTIAYLKERTEQDVKVRQEELQLRKDVQSAQEKQQNEMMQQLMNQQQHQQSIFSAFQQQQQQQLQQMNQIQAGLMQQQQQQSQALLAVLQELAQKK